MLTTIIVDDDIDVAESLSDLLHLHEFSILGRGINGKEAVELYEKFKPDLVLLDMQMPHYDGCYAVKGINKIDPNANIIIVTGDCRSEKIENIKETNVTILQKPLAVQEIINISSKIKSKMTRSST